MSGLNRRRPLGRNNTVRFKKKKKHVLRRNNTMMNLQNNTIHDRAENKLRRIDVDFTKVLGNKTYRTLTYVEDDVNIASSVDFALDTYRISNIFDPNPSFLTGGITGYPELSSIFFKWLTDKFSMDLSVINQESAKPITMGVLFNPDNLSSTITSRTLAINALERPGTMVKSLMMATASGQNRVTNLHFEVNPSTVYGNANLYFGSVNFSGSTPAGPPQDLFVHIIFIGPAALSLSAGVILSVKLTYEVKFFSVAPTLLASQQEGLRYLYVQHFEDLKRLGNKITNKKVLQCRIDFLQSISTYYEAVFEFEQVWKREKRRLAKLMLLAK